MLGSVLDELAGELVDVTILKINVDEAQETASEYGIQTLPTLILLKDQQKIGTKTGFVSKTSILRWLEETRES
jgi:thioredoxin 1